MNKKLLKRSLIFTIIFSVFIALPYGAYRYMETNKCIAVHGGNLKELSTKEKLEDFDYLYNIIKSNHPYLETEKRKTGYDWLSHKDEFEGWISSTKNNTEYYNTLNRILTLIQNGHTSLISPDSYDYYREIYKTVGNSKPWQDVLNNENVYLKYNDWKKIIKRQDYIIPCLFIYIEGNYVAVRSQFGNNEIIDKYNIPEYSILVKINDIPVDDYIKSLMDRKILMQDFQRNKVIMKSFTIPCSHGENIILTFKYPDGKEVYKNVSGIEYQYPSMTNIKPEKMYTTSLIKDKNAAYIKISSFDPTYTAKDKAGIHDFLESIKNYQYLIIDIRGNGGGDTTYWQNNIVAPLTDKKLAANFYCAFRGDYLNPFLYARLIFPEPISKIPQGLNYPPELIKSFDRFSSMSYEVKPSGTVGFKGKIYLIVDNYVYSSSEAFAAFAKATKWATIVGTETGGDGIGIDPALFALPNSGLIVRFPIEMGINPDGTANEETHTQPDKYIELTYQDFIKYNDYNKNSSDIINPYDTVLNKLFDTLK